MSPRQYARAQAIANDERSDPNERDNARRMCAEYEALHGKPETAFNKRPWWTLKVSAKESGYWLINNTEFRRALVALREGRKQYQYVFEWSTVKAIQDDEVDWVWFPEKEPWNMPYKMRRSVVDPLAVLDRKIGRQERLMEWVKVQVRRVARKSGKRPLGAGQLPGARRIKTSGPRR